VSEGIVEQEQFLEVLEREAAWARWSAAVGERDCGVELVRLEDALGRILAEDLFAPCDVPGFDRSNVDGYAVRAEATFGASEDRPIVLRLIAGRIAAGSGPIVTIGAGEAAGIATGGMLPRGASAVVMIEHTTEKEEELRVRRAVIPGANITFAGSDIARGERVLYGGSLLTARETGVLAALGLAEVRVRRRPRVAIVSTGDEVARPGEALSVGQIYDANQTSLADAVRELGCEPVRLGIVRDDAVELEAVLRRAIASADVVVLSGGTSKGEGDIGYRVLSRAEPGIVVHGVALKPGKPLCLGLAGERPVAILPGFPTSALFTFHEFVAPILRRMGGIPEARAGTHPARLSRRLPSERGRAEYVLVSLLEDGVGAWMAEPIGKGSGSVTAMGRADGYVVIPPQQEYVEAGEPVEVRLLGAGVRGADLVVTGSHCLGLDRLLGLLAMRGIRSKTAWVGSQAGLAAVEAGLCDLAGIHLWDEASGQYNAPLISERVVLIPGYLRMQGIVMRAGDARLQSGGAADAVRRILNDETLVMTNRNRGSGTRAVIDRLLGGTRPAGYSVEVRSHHAVAAAVAQGRSDWGVAIEPVARMYGLGFLPVVEERFDLAAPRTRVDRPALREFVRLLESDAGREVLRVLGFEPVEQGLGG
jgi:putative molybdopterin biosynthesis protein